MKTPSKLLLLVGAVHSTAAFTAITKTNSASSSFSRATRTSTPVFSSAQDDAHDEKSMKDSRRNFIHSISIVAPALLVGSTSLPIPSYAVDESIGATAPAFNLYQDPTTDFQIKTPVGWEQSEQSLPDRRRIVLFMNKNEDGGQDKDLVFVAYTPVRDDFTQLSSFGTVDQVGYATILPKGELMGVKSDNKMLSAVSKKGAYYFDYVSKVPGQPKRHFRTIFSLVTGATGGAGSVLVTITAQTTDDRYDELKSTFDEIIDSYGKLKK